jgi:hydrogenase-4 component F
MWVSMEAATLSTVLLVTLYRTPASLEAGWKYFILCGVGIAQALFGTILLYFASEKILGAEGMGALLWTNLNTVKDQLEPTVLSLAFVFLLVGYGTKVGLAPLHNWLPDAHAEGPTPISAVLSGLLLNVAIYAVVRCKVLVEGALDSALPSQMLMGFGIVSVVLAAFFLWRQRHDGAFAHQVGHLLRRRPRGAKGRHPGHGPDPRPDHDQPDGRVGIDARLAGHSRPAAFRSIRK